MVKKALAKDENLSRYTVKGSSKMKVILLAVIKLIKNI